jgi:hypothetical protein
MSNVTSWNLRPAQTRIVRRISGKFVFNAALFCLARATGAPVSAYGARRQFRALSYASGPAITGRFRNAFVLPFCRFF